jgi:hypothetical protein
MPTKMHILPMFENNGKTLLSFTAMPVLQCFSFFIRGKSVPLMILSTILDSILKFSGKRIKIDLDRPEPDRHDLDADPDPDPAK